VLVRIVKDNKYYLWIKESNEELECDNIFIDFSNTNLVKGDLMYVEAFMILRRSYENKTDCFIRSSIVEVHLDEDKIDHRSKV